MNHRSRRIFYQEHVVAVSASINNLKVLPTNGNRRAIRKHSIDRVCAVVGDDSQAGTIGVGKTGGATQSGATEGDCAVNDELVVATSGRRAG